MSGNCIRVTFANAVLCTSAATWEYLEKGQREVGRLALGAHGTTPKQAVQGDVGWSSSEAREAVVKLSFEVRAWGLGDERQSWSGLLVLDGVHFNKKGSRVFERILRGGLHGVVADHGQEAEDQECSRHAADEEHQELRRQYGDQAKELAEFWNGKYNFPSLSSSAGGGPAYVGEEQVQGMRTVTTTDTCTTSWVAVVQRPQKRVSRGHGGVDNTVRSRGCVPRTQSSQNTEPSRGVPAASVYATREQRLRGVKPSGMPMMLSDSCAPALVGEVWVHRRAGRSVAASGASVRPSSPVAQCIDPREGVLATACLTTRKRRRRGTKSSGMPMTQTGGRAKALVEGVWVHQKAGTSVAACGASVRPSSPVAQCIDPREGVLATACLTTRKRRRRGTKSSGMPMTQTGGRAKALVGGVWVHQKAGTSVAACGASVRPSSPVAQCIDPREGVLATACLTTRKRRRRGTKSSGMPMTQTGGRAPALVGGVWVHQKAGTSVAACGALVRPSSPVAQCIDPREGVLATHGLSHHSNRGGEEQSPQGCQ
ncbi:uncharacterized protein ISCGN_016254 [Ixodes scapularis]